VDGAPVGLSLVAAPGRDRALLALAERVAAKLTPVQRALVARGDRRELLDFLRRRRGA
jgi:hypothetical protein